MIRSTALYVIPVVAALGFAAPASAQVAHPGAAAAVVGSSQTGDVTQVQWGYGHHGYGRGYGFRGGYGGYGHRGYGFGPRHYGWGHRGYGWGHRGYGWGHRRYGW